MLGFSLIPQTLRSPPPRLSTLSEGEGAPVEVLPGAIRGGLRLAELGTSYAPWNGPPTWAEIKMDAEIGSYQEDFEPTRDPIVDGDEAGEAAAV